MQTETKQKPADRKTTTITVRVPTGHYEALREQCDNANISVSHIINKSIQLITETHKKNHRQKVDV
jgi:hypothetical protein